MEIHQNEIFDNKEQRWKEIIKHTEGGDPVDHEKITLYVRKVRGEASNYFVEFYSDLDRGLFYSKRRTDLEFGKEDEEEGDEEDVEV